ncbi:MAG: tetratricopeptide repeat protein [Rhodospirillaceae bacterium]|nr:tetratricopeptide repeat protein [Rhodospirillaceae bacterium]
MSSLTIPSEAETLLVAAFRHYEAGAFEAAEPLFQRCLARAPRNLRALRGMAAVLFQMNRREEAAVMLERAVAAHPGDLESWHNLASARAALRQFEAAEIAVRRALELDPASPPLHYDLARMLRAQSRLEEAVDAASLAVGGDTTQVRYERMIGDCLRALGRIDEAGAAYRRAIEIDPAQPDAAISLGALYRHEGYPDRALALYREVLDAHPDMPVGWFNLGAVCFDLDRTEEAIEAYRRAIALKPDFAEAHRYLGTLLQKLGRNDEARASFARAIELDPESPAVIADLLYRARMDCDWPTVAQYLRPADKALRQSLADGTEAVMSAHGALIFYDDPVILRDLARAQARRVAKRVRPASRPAIATADKKRLRIGYLSGDIGDHPVSHLTRGLFAAHDRGQVEVFVYSFGADDGSDYRRAIAGSVDRFVDLGGMNDVDAAQRIADDGIDILVDLNGQTGAARMGIPARRPAPVQAAWLGYPGTIGADWNDYLIADRIVAPADQTEFFVEKLCLLPHSYMVTDDRQVIAPGRMTRADAGLPDDAFVFASFNSSYKIDPAIFDCWSRIMRSVDRSVLWLPQFGAEIEARLRAESESRAIDPARLIFAPRLPKEWHLRRLALADLALDTAAYNGHTTTCDALWAGLPVLTLTGRSFARRVSASLLSAIGLPELAVSTIASYERHALGFARNRHQLSVLRGRLQHNRRSTPLFDTARFARDLERGYQAMWRQFAAGGNPVAIDIATDPIDG